MWILPLSEILEQDGPEKGRKGVQLRRTILGLNAASWKTQISAQPPTSSPLPLGTTSPAEVGRVETMLLEKYWIVSKTIPVAKYSSIYVGDWSSLRFHYGTVLKIHARLLERSFDMLGLPHYESQPQQ